jgi:hypothetical protein
VAERLGHASANVTLGIYSHALSADNLAVAKLWDDSLAGVLEESRKDSEANSKGQAQSSKSARAVHSRGGGLAKSSKNSAQKQLTLFRSSA